MNRIFKKIAIRISLLFLVVAAAAGLFSVIYLGNSYESDIKSDLMKSAKTVESIISDEPDYTKTLNAVDTIQDMRVTVMDYDGKVIFDTRAKADTLGSHATRPEVIQALAEGSGSDIRRSDTLGNDMMYLAIRSDDNRLIIRVSMLLEGIAAYSMALWIPLLTMLIIAFLLCLIIALFVSRSVTKPITQLKLDTELIAQGRYDDLEKLHTGDEMETLSVALFDMADKLRYNIDEITEKNSRLEAVFRAVPSGIVAVDNELRVIMANPAARGMFSMEEKPEGRHFLELTRHTGLESIINEASLQRSVIERELIVPQGMDELRLQVFAVSVFSEGKVYGVILLVQDITHLRKLESMRSDFAANVSHELKTPLTVIQGFIETLKDPSISKEDMTRFLDIITLESERLTRLINDVLLLSEIESIAERPFSAVDMNIAIAEAARMLESVARQKGLDFNVDIEQKPLLIKADPDRIKQMAINLIENAIKYTLPDGKVHIYTCERDGEGVLGVEDTGIGIPEENLSRLFERFYRVDTSRSRALGGTGLGLAIVKHIVSSLGGHIIVNSTVGAGSAFVVSVPLLSEKRLESKNISD